MVKLKSIMTIISGPMQKTLILELCAKFHAASNSVLNCDFYRQIKIPVRSAPPIRLQLAV